MGYPYNITLYSKLSAKGKGKYSPLVKIVIENGLFIHTKNVLILNYNINIHFMLRHKIYCSYHFSLTMVNMFAVKIAYKCEVKISRLIKCRECMII